MTYANADVVTSNTQSIAGQKSPDNMVQMLNNAIEHAERKINSTLRMNNVEIPLIPTDLTELDTTDPLMDLVQAGTLYASAFIFDTILGDNETGSPASKSYLTDADSLVDNYIEYYFIKNPETHPIIISCFGVNGDDERRDRGRRHDRGNGYDTYF